jgi:hypothetical protein
VSSPEFRDCSFIGNSTPSTGGAINIWCGGEPLFTDCLFKDNSAGEAGAMMLFCFVFGTLDHCTFIGNTAEVWGGSLASGKMSDVTMSYCTFYGNSAPRGAVFSGGELQVEFENCILAFSTGGEPVTCETQHVILSCCDIYGNEGGDWVGCIADQFGTAGNISEDPLFCDPANDDLTLDSDSVCAEENNPDCGQIGAWPIGCDHPVAVQETSWGRIKRSYR